MEMVADGERHTHVSLVFCFYNSGIKWLRLWHTAQDYDSSWLVIYK